MEKISSLQKRITNEKLTKVSDLRQDEVNVITSVSSIALMEHFIAGEKVCFSNCLWLCAFALLFVQTLSNIILSYIKEKMDKNEMAKVSFVPAQENSRRDAQTLQDRDSNIAALYRTNVNVSTYIHTYSINPSIHQYIYIHTYIHICLECRQSDEGSDRIIAKF